MAQSVAQRIVELEARLTAINAKIEASEQFRAVEEGSAQARFRSEFTEITKLYEERDRIRTRLTVLGWEGI